MEESGETQKPAVFFGAYELTLDPKHRLSVPAAIRKRINPSVDGSTLFAVVGANNKIWIFTESSYIEQARQPANLTPSDEEQEFSELMHSGAEQLDMDAQNRILIPDRFLKKTEIKNNDVTLIGKSDHLELWNQQDWRERFAKLEGKRGEITARRAARVKAPLPAA